HAGELERPREDRRRGLTSSCAGRRDHTVEQGRQVQPQEHVLEGDIPVGDDEHSGGQTPDRLDRLPGVGESAEPQRFQEDRLERVDLYAVRACWERLAECLRATASEAGQALAIPTFVEMCSVVGDLGRECNFCLRGTDLYAG